jgi:hypothetical protein
MLDWLVSFLVAAGVVAAIVLLVYYAVPVLLVLFRG